jgi:hypothetical protein
VYTSVVTVFNPRLAFPSVASASDYDSDADTDTDTDSDAFVCALPELLASSGFAGLQRSKARHV